MPVENTTAEAAVNAVPHNPVRTSDTGWYTLHRPQLYPQCVCAAQLDLCADMVWFIENSTVYTFDLSQHVMAVDLLV